MSVLRGAVDGEDLSLASVNTLTSLCCSLPKDSDHMAKRAHSLADINEAVPLRFCTSAAGPALSLCVSLVPTF